VFTAALLDPREDYISNPWTDPMLIPFYFIIAISVIIVIICAVFLFSFPKRRYSRKEVKFNTGIFILCLFIGCIIWGGASFSYDQLSTQNNPNDDHCDICGRRVEWTWETKDTVIHEYCDEHALIFAFFSSY
jgi:energy-coupling factor transporter transmembrane protein EcfT